jgi:hypothetical protein
MNNASKNFRIPLVAFLLLSILLSIGTAYLITLVQKQRDRELIEKRITDLFEGKDEICDYYRSSVNGTLKKVEKRKGVILMDGDFVLEPTIPDSSSGGVTNYFYQEDLSKWNNYKDIVDYYYCLSGGFTVLTLKKKINGYDLEISESKNMAFKVPSSKIIPGYNYGYGLSQPDYVMSTYRPSPQTAYDNAMKYLSSDQNNKSYIAGKYDVIKTFHQISTDFHYIDNIPPTKISASSVNAISWKKNDAWVFNSQWIVWYDIDGRHYEVVEYKKEFKKRWLIYSCIGSILSLIIYLIIKYRKRITIDI